MPKLLSSKIVKKRGELNEKLQLEYQGTWELVDPLVAANTKLRECVNRAIEEEYFPLDFLADVLKYSQTHP